MELRGSPGSGSRSLAMRHRVQSWASYVLLLHVASCGRESSPASNEPSSHGGSSGTASLLAVAGTTASAPANASGGFTTGGAVNASAGTAERTTATTFAGGGSSSALMAGAAGIAGDGVAGSLGTAVPWLTPCRDLSSGATRVSAASASPYFLVANTLGASVIQADDFRVLRTFTGQFGEITAAQLSPDATFGASIGTDKALRLWRAADGKETATIHLAALPTRLSVSPSVSKPFVAIADESKTVRVFDATSGVEQWNLIRDVAPTFLAFSPSADELLILSASSGEWCSAATGICSSGFSLSNAGVSALSPDGTTLAIAAPGATTVSLLRASDGAPRTTLNVGTLVNALSFNTDATALLVASSNGVQAFDVAAAQLLRNFGTQRYATGVAFSSDGQTVATSSTQVDYYRFSDGALLASFGQTGFVWNGSFAPNGTYEFSGAAGPVQVWDPILGVRLLTVPRPNNGNQGQVMFAPNGSLLVNHDATATFWDVSQATEIRSFDYQTTETRPEFSRMVFSKDGKILIGEGTPPNPGDIRFWDASNGQLLRTIPAYGYGVGVLAISPSGDLLASSGAELGSTATGAALGSQYIKLWSVATGELVRQLAQATDEVTDIRFSPDGTLLLTGQRNGSVRLWSVADGSVVRDLAAGRQYIEGAMSNYLGNSVAFSPDGKLAASAGVDWTVTESHTGAISFWSVQDGSLKARLLSLVEGNLGSIEWSPDATSFAAGTSAGVRVWCLDELRSAPTVMPPPSRVAQP